MPLDQITHSHVVFAKQRHPTLLVLAALIVLAGGYYWVEEANMHGYSVMYAAVAALLFVGSFFWTSKTQMMAKFVSPTQEIAVYWKTEGADSHGQSSDDFGMCAAYKAVWQVEQARMALLATRR